MDRHLRIKINLNAIKRNFNTIKDILRTDGQKIGIIGVVKADAYGHGALEVSKVLQEGGIDYLAVAYIDEALSLREEGIKVPLLVLFEEFDPKKFIRYNLRPVIHSLKELETLERTLSTASPPVYIHLKIDTGMGRLGILPDEVIPSLKIIINSQKLRLEGIMSHFSEAELTDKYSASRQLRLFEGLVSETQALLKREILCHMANSAALFSLPESWFSGVRPGLSLYGYLPGDLEDRNLQPAMKVLAKLLTIRKLKKGTPISYGGIFITKRESLIGIITAGYADGLSRSLSNKGYVLFMGKRAPIVGRICMDLTMIDLTDIINDMNRIDREVILLGSQDGEAITAKDIARWANTIPYEILTTFGGLGKREYDKEGH